VSSIYSTFPLKRITKNVSKFFELESQAWHGAGRPIAYTAQSLSLAALEILVRLKQTPARRQILRS
jgi:hypothetical protein